MFGVVTSVRGVVTIWYRPFESGMCFVVLCGCCVVRCVSCVLVCVVEADVCCVELCCAVLCLLWCVCCVVLCLLWVVCGGVLCCAVVRVFEFELI